MGIFEKNKDVELDLTTYVMCFWKNGSLHQILDLFRCDKNFSCEYDLEEGYSNNNCIRRLITKNYLNPYIIFREEDTIQNVSIIQKFNELLINDLTTCKKCGYDIEGNIFDKSWPTFYRVPNSQSGSTSVQSPLFLIWTQRVYFNIPVRPFYFIKTKISECYFRLKKRG